MDHLDHPIAEATAGSYDYYRIMAAGSTAVGGDNDMAAFSADCQQLFHAYVVEAGHRIDNNAKVAASFGAN